VRLYCVMAIQWNRDIILLFYKHNVVVFSECRRWKWNRFCRWGRYFMYNGAWMEGYCIETVAVRGNYLFRRFGLLPQDWGQYNALRENAAQYVAAHLLYSKNVNNKVRKLWNVRLYIWKCWINRYFWSLCSVCSCYVPEDKITTADWCTRSECVWRNILC
jgi:hypothetical protein